MATFFGTGRFPWAPATLASLVVAVAFGLLPSPGILTQGILLAVVSLVGVISAGLAEQELGLDAGPIVIDEVAGMLVTYLLVPLPTELGPRLVVLGAGFVFFRIFDILKPFPVDRIQHLPGGYGIMADDLLAGFYANLALRFVTTFLLARFIPGLS